MLASDSYIAEDDLEHPILMTTMPGLCSTGDVTQSSIADGQSTCSLSDIHRPSVFVTHILVLSIWNAFICPLDLWPQGLCVATEMLTQLTS